MHIYFILWVIIQILLSILFCSNNSSNCHWGLTQVGSCILLILAFYLYSPFLGIPYFLPTRCSILILCFPCLRPKTRYVPKSPVSFYWKQAFRNQDLEAECAHCCWVVTIPKAFQRTKLGKCVYINPHSYLYFWINLFAYIIK